MKEMLPEFGKALELPTPEDVIDRDKKDRKTLSQQVSRLENDFLYQYKYNGELVEQVAKLTREMDSWREDHLVEVRKRQALEREKENFSPSTWMKTALFVQAVVIILLGGVFFYEKCVEPIDNLLGRVSISIRASK